MKNLALNESQMSNDQIHNVFEIEELEQRLETGDWSAGGGLQEDPVTHSPKYVTKVEYKFGG